MTDDQETHHIARQAAALDDPGVRRSQLDLLAANLREIVSEAEKDRDRLAQIAATIRVNALRGGATTEEAEAMVRGDKSFIDWLADRFSRPSQAGVIRPLCWIDDTESKCTRAYAPALGGKMMVVELDPGSGEYSAGIDLSGLCFRFVLDTYHDGLGAFTAPAKFPSIEAAKSAAQADYEARVSSSLVETVGVEALVSFARPFADALDIECDFMTPPAPFEDGFDVRRRARAALAAMDTPKGGGDE